MTTMKEILDSLKPEDKALLEYAFQHDIGQFIRLPNNRFIGVNIDHMTYLKPDMIAGAWRAGVDASMPKNGHK